jgi:hypothetical protein
VNFHILSHAICAKLLASIAGDLDEKALKSALAAFPAIIQAMLEIEFRGPDEPPTEGFS